MRFVQVCAEVKLSRCKSMHLVYNIEVIRTKTSQSSVYKQGHRFEYILFLGGRLRMKFTE